MEPERRPSSRAGPSEARQRGFTLIETVALLAIMSLLIGIALPALPRQTSQPKLEAVALAAAAIFEADHYAAVRRHVGIASIVDAPARTIVSGASGRVVQVPADVSVEARLADRCGGVPAGGSIVFLANGTSCGGALILDRGDFGFEINVNWLTGATEIVPRKRS